jgi:hypothetical protein
MTLPFRFDYRLGDDDTAQISVFVPVIERGVGPQKVTGAEMEMLAHDLLKHREVLRARAKKKALNSEGGKNE